MKSNRISKREFLSRVSARAGVTLDATTAVYHAIIDEVLAVTSAGGEVLLTGFGRFYPLERKGHTVQTGAGLAGGKQRIDDYMVLKFSSTRDTNRQLQHHVHDEHAAAS